MILVTGGAGFIGSNLVAALNRRGESRVVVSDRLGEDRRWKNLATAELADLIEPEALPAWLARQDQVEAVFHLGAISATTETDVGAIVRNNIRLSFDLWDWCTAARVPFVYASSASTYGDGSAGFVDEDSPEALARLVPLNAYGWSKLLVDRRFARLKAEGAPQPPFWYGMRFFNVYGPREDHKGGQKSVVAHLYPKLAAGEPARLFKSYRSEYPDGGQLRDFVAVDDCVDLMLYLQRQQAASGIYNSGTGQARSFDDLARAVFTALETPARIDYIDMPEALRQHYQYYTQADMAKARATGWNQPATALEAGVAAYIESHLARQDLS